MLLSELIKDLEDIKRKYGDVQIYDDYYYYERHQKRDPKADKDHDTIDWTI